MSLLLLRLQLRLRVRARVLDKMETDTASLRGQGFLFQDPTVLLYQLGKGLPVRSGHVRREECECRSRRTPHVVIKQ